MGKLILFIFLLFALVAIGLVGYAYLGPLLGADFRAPQQEIRVPVTLKPINGG